ncbi:hypothetical protein KMW28_05330 [Flammeovirga yaeyamensis]|uniref:histidine kinase n=1 Tax=Flammeovirga yaeyamensis TaxID=367791 RepID=A0AAX1NAH3_9BACT|nr:ATP-binding protein [Flammeovirga yaeyamensis]MBB3697586.1 signal transduction histidine kinase [Flammeovirga yaeyamensis]NMF36276.1 hypothetical protein [Flammeovirga yaeyamensis]QWG03003.1 hypothetical protein KMW28_05330 [Flammeovirga yaeyamensis]
MGKSIVVSFILFLFIVPTFASNVVLLSSDNETINCTKFVENYSDRLPFHAEGEDPNFLNAWQQTSFDGLSNGPFDGVQWYRLKLQSEHRQNKVLYFNYILVPEITVWVKHINNRVEKYELGSNSSFYHNPDQPLIRGYDIPLYFEKGEVIEVIFFKNGYGWPTHTDILLCDTTSFERDQKEATHYLVILRVLVLTMLTIGLVIGLLSKERVFLFYAFSFYSGILFAETELGSFIKYFDKEWLNFSYYLRHFANLFYIISLVYFYKYLIHNVHSGFVKFTKWFTPLWLGYTLITAFIFLLTRNETVISIIFVSVVLLSWVSFGWCFYLLYHSVKRKSMYGKIAFGVLITRLIVIAGFVSLPNLGVIERSTFTDYLYYIFIAYESVLYFVMLFIKVISIYNDRIRLLSKQKELEKEYSDAVLKGQEFERNRIGRELHDNVGGNLALVNKSDHLEEDEVKDIISSTIKTVRDMSHGLISPSFNDVVNFEDSIYDLVEKASTDEMKIYIKFYHWPYSDNIEALNHCYRIIQELLHNAEKHSQSKSVHIQCFGDDATTARIIYEDNGVGFNVDKVKDGVGLSNIRFRTSAVGGTSAIESSKFGTVIRIENIQLSSTVS